MSRGGTSGLRTVWIPGKGLKIAFGRALRRRKKKQLEQVGRWELRGPRKPLGPRAKHKLRRRQAGKRARVARRANRA